MPCIRVSIPGEVKGLARPKLTSFKGHARAYDPSVNVLEKGRLQVFLRDYLKESSLIGHTKADGRGYSLKVNAYFHCPKSMSKRTRSCAMEGSLRVTRKPDADNILKLVCDAWNSMLWDDDAEITSMEVHKHYGEKDGMEVIVIWEEPRA